MEDYNRSRSYGPGSMQIESYYGGPPRSYSTNSDEQQQNQSQNQNRDLKLKKGKGNPGLSSSSSSSRPWSFGDPEFQRKKRVASYKMYSVEGKMKGSIRKSFRWLKDRYTHVLYGWW